MTILAALQLALQHHQAGRLAEAEAIYRQVLAVEPRNADALQLLGALAHQVGRNDVAVDMIRRALELNPNYAQAHYNLGCALGAQGQWEDAIASYRRTLELKPDYAEAHYNLGCALEGAGRLEGAIAAYRQALKLRPDYPEARNNLGNSLRKQGFPDEAIAEYHRALETRPDDADFHCNLGVALEELGRFDEAIVEYLKTLQLKPNSLQARFNMGNALRHQGHQDAALAEYRRALQLNPNFPDALTNQGNILKDRGEIDDALASYRLAVRAAPGNTTAHSNLLLVLHYASVLDDDALFAEHRHWDEVHARPLAKCIEVHANDPNPDRRLRIGYVSSDFREHSAAYFFEGLLAHHDRAQVETFCYADLAREDAVTERLRGHAAHWRSIRRMRDAEAAALIREDKIDILVDLAGHTADNRLPIFARKPAPIQVTYLGYCDTTGMETMDYRLTDAHADPVGATAHLHCERLFRLPDSAWCFRPPEDSPEVGVPPVMLSGHLTFGCFSTMPKITDEWLAIWSRILQRVPGSRLLLKNIGLQDSSVRQRVLAAMEHGGVAPERVELLARVPALAEHLACYNRVDIALDTFPYHGTTTTCEALWMGVPVVTLAGKVHASRVGVSLLSSAGLPELIATSREEYVRIAVKLAVDVDRLAELRGGLRARMASSPLMNGPRFARNVEHAYRQMWRQWCAK